ncbi:DUF397 domain-containing protein [Streptomyces sp. NPDC050504]|uniref:DUF397 domain-containing protein n=1 Tax=Streptomyces sp. NPDC050504 TaxID=3365618 RepID=UPI00378A1675
MTIETPHWFTSSYSNNGGACVQVAVNLTATRGIVPVRDTKSPDGPTLNFLTGAFTSFVTGIKEGAS